MSDIDNLIITVDLNISDFTPDQKEHMIRTLFLSCLAKGKEMTHQRVVEQFHTCSGYFKVCDWLKKLGVEE